MLTIQAREGQDLPLGRQGENYARRVSFDFSAWADAYGFGIPRLLVQRPSDSAPYPVTLSAETDSEHGQASAFWDVSATDTEHAGTGRAELRYYSGETLVKSAVFHTSVTPSLATPETAPPAPGSSWADGILDAASRAERAAMDAALATANIDNVQVRTVTLEPGSPASVSAVSENGVRTMTFSIPAGTPGRDGTDGTNGINGTDGTNGTDGADGADGVSVTGIETVSATTLSGGENTYRLVLSNGEKLPFSVRNGAKGDKGDPFTIAASYASYNAMTADFSNANIPEGSFVVISSNPEDPHNAELYHKGGAAWELVTDLSGAQGLTGPAGNGIDYVEENTNSAGDTLVTLHFTDSNVQPFPFTVHRGLPGQNGANGGRGEKGDDGEKGDKGDDATINGVNALTIQPGNNNIHFSQSGSVLSISSDNTTYSPAVSGGANGLMTGTDKAKLDGIEAGATANIGTITGITMNDTSMGTSGVVNLGNVFTSTSLGENVDFNSVQTKGVYTIYYNTGTISSDYHAPIIAAGPLWCNLIVFGPGSRLTQFCTCPYTMNQRHFIRYKHDATWSDWIELFNAADRAKLDSISLLASGVSMPVILDRQSIATFTSSAAGRPLRVTVNIEPQQAAGTPSPSNPLPITGFSSANVTLAGKNLWSLGDINVTEGWGYRQYNFVLGPGQYTLTGEISNTKGDSTNLVAFAYGDSVDTNLEYVNVPIGSRNPATFTLSKKTKYVLLYPGGGYGQPFTGLYTNLQIESGGTATAYDAYQAQSITISFGSAGTVYGGTLDLARGLLTVTHASVDFTSLSFEGSGIFIATLPNNAPQNVPGGIDGICTHYVRAAESSLPDASFSACNSLFTTVQRRLLVKDNRFDSLSAFQSFINTANPRLIYPLATPITNQLTPQQFVTLDGSNNVFADCGPVTVTHWPGAGTPVEPVDDTAAARQIEVFWRAILALGGNL